MKLWLDDARDPPDSAWTWVRTVAEAIRLVTGGVTEASLDNDLGQDADGDVLAEGRTLVYWMAENDCWPSEAIDVHSANVDAVRYMLGMIERYGPFVREGSSTRFIRSREPSPER